MVWWVGCGGVWGVWGGCGGCGGVAGGVGKEAAKSANCGGGGCGGGGVVGVEGGGCCGAAVECGVRWEARSTYTTKKRGGPAGLGWAGLGRAGRWGWGWGLNLDWAGGCWAAGGCCGWGWGWGWGWGALWPGWGPGPGRPSPGGLAQAGPPGRPGLFGWGEAIGRIFFVFLNHAPGPALPHGLVLVSVFFSYFFRIFSCIFLLSYYFRIFSYFFVFSLGKYKKNTTRCQTLLQAYTKKIRPPIGKEIRKKYGTQNPDPAGTCQTSVLARPNTPSRLQAFAGRPSRTQPRPAHGRS